MTNPTQKHALQTLLELSESDLTMISYCGHVPGRVSPMGPEGCLGITGRLGDILATVAAVALHEGHRFSELDKDAITLALTCLRIDSLGKGSVVYFPRVYFVEPEVTPLDALAQLLDEEGVPYWYRADGSLDVANRHSVTHSAAGYQIDGGPLLFDADSCAKALIAFENDHD